MTSSQRRPAAPADRPAGPHRPRDAVLIVADGNRRSAAVVDQSLACGLGVAVVGLPMPEIAAFLDARHGGQVWPVRADPACPEQIAEVVGRAPRHVGRVRMVIDPSGLLTDIAALDRQVA